MKKLFLLVLLVVLFYSSNAQTYYPFATENKVWAQVSSSWGNEWTYYMKLQGDTTINDTIYKVIYSCSDSLQLNWTKNNNYFIREDSSKRAYKRESDSEKLIYDFTLQAGDSIDASPSWGGNFYAKVDSVDSVLIDGSYRKKIIFDSWFNEFWIEGIGSSTETFSPFINSFIADLGYMLLCVHENDILIYQNPFYSDCWVITVGMDEFPDNSSEINIFPNPANDRIEITVPENSQIEILNIEGQVMENLVAGDSQITVDVSAFAKGVYLIKILYEREVIFKRIIIE